MHHTLSFNIRTSRSNCSYFILNSSRAEKKIIVIIMLSILQVNLIKFEWIEKQMRELFTESLWLYIFVMSTALNSLWISLCRKNLFHCIIFSIHRNWSWALKGKLKDFFIIFPFISVNFRIIFFNSQVSMVKFSSLSCSTCCWSWCILWVEKLESKWFNFIIVHR